MSLLPRSTTARVRDRRYASRVRGGPARRASGGGAWKARCGLPLALTLLAIPATSAEEIAVRVRDDGRVDVRATAAPVAAVLGRLAALTEMRVAYEGPPPRRLVTLETSSASQARAVLDVLESVGADYAVSTNEAGTRVLALVVADTPANGHPDPEAVASESPPAADALPPAALPPESATDTPPPDTTTPDVGELGDSQPDGPAEGTPLLPGMFVPGVRATGQTTEWGVPEFVLPDPPGPKASAAEGAIVPSEPDGSVAGTGSQAPPVP
jgi:hypothetical protein